MIKTKSDYRRSSWSGGTTTELFIYPSESSYKTRDFNIRISSATVELEESNFTQLPDYDRVLMILQGDLEINHHGHYSQKLSKYDSDYFDGAWNTTAKGKVIDFNLMTSKSLKGNLKYQKITEDSLIILEKSTKHLLVGLYIISGKLLIKEDNQEIHEGDFLYFDKQDHVFNLQAIVESQVIHIYVS